MTAQSVFIIAAFLAVYWRISVMSVALDRLNTAVDGLIARAAAATPQTDGATAAELDAVTARINAADQSSPAASADQTPPAFG